MKIKNKFATGLFLYFISLSILFYSEKISAQGQGENWGHLYVAAGSLYGLGSIRLGHKNYEIGMLNSHSFGACVLLRAGNPYAAFGAILNQNAFPGLYGGVGIIWDYFNHFNIRLELNGSSGFDGYSHGEGLVGAGVFF